VNVFKDRQQARFTCEGPTRLKSMFEPVLCYNSSCEVKVAE